MSKKKIVITGGPGTGKTSIINDLKNRGYTCLDEISRQITLDAREKGIEQLFLTEPLLFSELLIKGRKQQFVEAQNLATDLVFLDRGLPDVLAYMDYIGDIYPKTFVESCHNHTYDGVFILAPWQEIFQSDAERYENFEQAVEIHHHLLTTYKNYNYHLIDVPFDTIKNRTNFILNILHTM